MSEYIRSLPVNIETVEVTRKTQFLGWRIYINGEEYPEKPAICYPENEETAIHFAILAYKKRNGVN